MQPASPEPLLTESKIFSKILQWRFATIC